MLEEYLGPEGFAVAMVHDGPAALERIGSDEFDLIILDVMLPGLSGLDVLRDLHGKCATPVLMLTARGDDVDRIVGLELGADDYLPKPFNPRELVARIRAILRRAATRASTHGGARTLQVGPISLNAGNRKVHVREQPMHLTGTEFKVLELLMREPGQVISRDDLTREALGRRLTPFDRSIDTHVSNLRRKLGHHAGGDPMIRNVRGAGYVLTLPDDEP